MRSTLRSILLPLVILTAVGFTIIVLNQTVQLVDLADRVHPVFGTAVMVTILIVFAICVLVPGYTLIRLPTPLIPPDEVTGPAYEQYREALSKRLSSNPHLAPIPAKGVDLDESIEKLNQIAEKRTKEFATKVFLGTAISQNGSIDSLLVLAAQGRLVYEIACIFNQRPTVREFAYLYSNVAATAFIAGELDDIDVAEHMQPIVTSVIGSSVAAIPGMSAAAGLFINSVVTGSGNAYLTLRVGLLAREYSGLRAHPDRRSSRHKAALEALPLLGSIVSDGAASVASSIWARPKKFFSDVIDSALDTLKRPWRKSDA